MKNAVIATAIGIVAGLILAGGWFGARQAGVVVPLVTLMTAAAILTFAMSTAAFALLALTKAEPKPIKSTTRLNDLPASEFYHPIRQPDTINIVVKPESVIEHLLIRYGELFKKPPEEVERNILLTIKKSSDKTVMHNPIVLKELFTRLPFKNFQHILLVNEHDEFLGYIPANRARITFTEAGAEGHIAKYIIGVLADPATSWVLREIDGLAKEDTIADNETVAQAAARSWGGLIRGLMILKAGRNRKPLGIIFAEDLYKLAAYGA